MIVSNTGYIKHFKISEMFFNKEKFCLYETHKKTIVLVKGASHYPESTTLYLPKMDRLPWKNVEGRKIVRCTKIFDSETDAIESIEIGNQLMSYEEFHIPMS